MPARLLLADDSITIQRVIELTFVGEDVAVTAVGDGAAAIARLDAEPPDIVLADIGMPEKSGYDVAEHVRRTPSLAHIPVLLLTGASEPADEARVRALGCAGVLVKPFEPQMVISRVRELLGARRPEPDGRAPAPAAQRSASPSHMAPEPATSAVPAVSPEARAQSSREVDDYFAQLDAAFANLAEAPRVTTATPAAPRGAAEERAAGVNAPPQSITMAGAFEALLGAEHGEPLPPFLDEAAVSAQRKDAIAARVAADTAERIVREIAPDLVSEIAERIVREEIERMKAAATPASPPE